MMSSKKIKWMDLMKHNTSNDCWVLIEETVYDVTGFLADHPGGGDILLKNGGKDATQAFRDANHTGYSLTLRDQLVIGEIEDAESPEEYKRWVKETKKVATKYTWDEVRRHNNKLDLWVVIEGKVFDFTTFYNKHPGGSSVILGKGGRDATEVFEVANHPASALSERENYQIGIIEGEDPNPFGDSKFKTGLFNPLNILVVLLIGAFAFHFFGTTFIKN